MPDEIDQKEIAELVDTAEEPNDTDRVEVLDQNTTQAAALLWTASSVLRQWGHGFADLLTQHFQKLRPAATTKTSETPLAEAVKQDAGQTSAETNAPAAVQTPTKAALELKTFPWSTPEEKSATAAETNKTKSGPAANQEKIF